MIRFAIAGLLLLASIANAATTVTASPGFWVLYRGTSIVQPRVNQPSLDACMEQAKALGVERLYTCRTQVSVVVKVITDPTPCPPQPATQTRTQACPAGTTGSWSQTSTYVAAPPPACWVAGPWTPATAPAGACVTPPPVTGCTTTLDPGADVAAALKSAASGSVVCLNSGNYGTLKLNDIMRSSYVTLKSVAKHGAYAGKLEVYRSTFVRVQDMSFGWGLQEACAKNIEYVGNKWAEPYTLKNEGCGDIATTFDGNTFPNVDVGGGYEGRLSIVYGSGVTLKNNTFGPGGKSDGVFIGGGASNILLKGNKFTGISQAACGAVHCDAFQIYGGGTGIVLEENIFEKGDTFIMAPDGSDGVTVKNNSFDGTGIGNVYKVQFGSARNLVFTGNKATTSSVAIDSKTGQPASTNAVATGNTMVNSHFKTSGGNGCTNCTIQSP